MDNNNEFLEMVNTVENYIKDSNLQWHWEVKLRKDCEQIWNLSEMFALLRDESKNCINYATDIEYDISACLDLFVEMQDGNFDFPTNAVHYFGFRDNGVDSLAYLVNIIENPDMYGKFESRYFAVYKLVFSKLPENDYITATLLGLEF